MSTPLCALSMLSLIEPESLIRHFIAHPPTGFRAGLGEGGVPLFSMPFDLLTTLETNTRKLIETLPGYTAWRRALRPQTCFIGTTVSEYLPLPQTVPAGQFAERTLQTLGPQQPLLVLKDLPWNSPLLSRSANAFAEEVTEACRTQGCAVLAGQALSFVPMDFDSVGGYLRRLSPARRKDFKRKLRSADQLSIERVLTGNKRWQDPTEIDLLYSLYLNVYHQSSIHFDLLTRDFFAATLTDENSNGVAFLYRLAGRIIGFNLCYRHDGKLLDKYIGFRYPEARDANLYFVSWFHNLEYALEHGLAFYVAGWTDPEVKRTLGASFTWTRHAVYARNPILRALLHLTRGRFESDRAWHEGLHAPAAGRS